MSTGAGAEPIWTPDPVTSAASELERFRVFVNDRHHLALADYTELHRWSVEHLAEFVKPVEFRFTPDKGP